MPQTCSRQTDASMAVLLTVVGLGSCPTLYMLPVLSKEMVHTWWPNTKKKSEGGSRKNGSDDPSEQTNKNTAMLIVWVQLFGLMEGCSRLMQLYLYHNGYYWASEAAYFLSALGVLMMWISLAAYLTIRLTAVFEYTPLQMTKKENKMIKILTCIVVLSCAVFVGSEIFSPTNTAFWSYVRAVSGGISTCHSTGIFILLGHAFNSRLTTLIVNTQQHHGSGTNVIPAKSPTQSPKGSTDMIINNNDNIHNNNEDNHHIHLSAVSMDSIIDLDQPFSFSSMQPSAMIRTASCFSEHCQAFILVAGKHSVLTVWILSAHLMTLSAIVLFSFDRCINNLTYIGNVLYSIGCFIAVICAGLCEQRFNSVYNSPLCMFCDRKSKTFAATIAHYKFVQKMSVNDKSSKPGSPTI